MAHLAKVPKPSRLFDISVLSGQHAVQDFTVILFTAPTAPDDEVEYGDLAEPDDTNYGPIAVTPSPVSLDGDGKGQVFFTPAVFFPDGSASASIDIYGWALVCNLGLGVVYLALIKLFDGGPIEVTPATDGLVVLVRYTATEEVHVDP